MQQVQYPSFEKRVVRSSGGLEQRTTQDRNRVRLSLQCFAEGREQVRLLFRIRGHAERGRECLQWVHRRYVLCVGCVGHRRLRTAAAAAAGTVVLKYWRSSRDGKDDERRSV
jgi:hypothetical protein